MYQSVWRSLDHTGASPPLPVESTAAGRAGESGGAIAAVEHGSSAELGGLSPGGGVGSISLHPHAAEVTEVSSALWVRLGYGGRSCLFYSCNEGSMGGYG